MSVAMFAIMFAIKFAVMFAAIVLLGAVLVGLPFARREWFFIVIISVVYSALGLIVLLLAQGKWFR